MTVTDLPIAGRVVAVMGPLVDLLVNGGEFVAILVSFLVSNIALVYSLVASLESLADRLPWMSAAMLDDLVTILLVAVLVIEVGRLLTKATQS